MQFIPKLLFAHWSKSHIKFYFSPKSMLKFAPNSTQSSHQRISEMRLRTIIEKNKRKKVWLSLSKLLLASHPKWKSFWLISILIGILDKTFFLHLKPPPLFYLYSLFTSHYNGQIIPLFQSLSSPNLFTVALPNISYSLLT